MVSSGGGAALGAEGEEALANKGWVKTRRHDSYTRGKKRLHLLGALDLPATLEVGRPLLLLLLIMWRWRWHRGTSTPLRAGGLGPGLLGPASSPLALLGGSETSDSSARCSLRRLSSSVPRNYLGRRHCLQPLCPYPKGWGPRQGWRWGLHRWAGDLQPVHQGSGSHEGGPDRWSGELPCRSRRGSAT